jgi:molybdopterin biosynthesis enzyme
LPLPAENVSLDHAPGRVKAARVVLPRLHAQLDAELHARAGRSHFVHARLHREAEGFVVKPLANQCSALVRTAADANGSVAMGRTIIPWHEVLIGL